MVTRADIMILEARLRGLARHMNVKVTHQPRQMNTQYDNPVLINWGSNGFYVDAQDLEDLMDLLDSDQQIDAPTFLQDYWWPFLRKHQSYL